MTPDTSFEQTIQIVPVLLSAHVERFSVSLNAGFVYFGNYNGTRNIEKRAKQATFKLDNTQL